MCPNKAKTETNQEELKFRCLVVKQANYKLYCFAAPARTLWEILKINQRDIDKDTGYQRALSSSRVQSIANYIDHKNPIPNSILVALKQDFAWLSTDKRNLIIKNKEDAGWVIDGQHRLAGAKESQSEIPLFVIAFIGLGLKEQIQQFVTINREAKGVPTSLYYDLLKHLPTKKSEAEMGKERAADIANILRKDEDSLFFNRIVISTPKKGQLSLTNFVRKISPLLVRTKGKFNLYSLQEQTGVLNNYFKALDHAFPSEFDENKMSFFKTLGFGALINALPTVFDLSMKNYGGFQVSDVVEVLKKVDYFDFSAWDQYGTGNAAEIQAGEDFRQELLSMFKKLDESGSLKL